MSDKQPQSNEPKAYVHIGYDKQLAHDTLKFISKYVPLDYDTFESEFLMPIAKKIQQDTINNSDKISEDTDLSAKTRMVLDDKHDVDLTIDGHFELSSDSDNLKKFIFLLLILLK